MGFDNPAAPEPPAPNLQRVPTPTSSSLPDGIDLERAGAATLLHALRAGSLSARALTAAYLERIDTLDRGGPGLRCVRAINPAALEEAEAADRRRAGGDERPLLGLPVLLKDNVDLVGLPTTAGAVALADSSPPADAFLVGRLRAAGAVVLGKANLTEMANFLSDRMPSGYSSVAGQVLNPYDASVTPSGSSSGSAVAVAAGLAVLAVGTETNGSILSPASACSVVGIKPTLGRVSRSGILPIAHSQDTAGPLATDVAGAALLLAALSGHDPADPASTDPSKRPAGRPEGLAGARLGVVGAGLQPAAAPAWEAALAAAAARGATLEELALEPAPSEFSVLTFEFAADLDAYFASLGPGAPIRSAAALAAWNAAHADVALKYGQRRLTDSLAVARDDPAEQARYHDARRADLAASRDQLDRVLAAGHFDALVFPDAGSADLGARSGYPSLALPIGYDDVGRRPVGLTLLGPAWSEELLVDLAADLEATLQARRPPSELNPAAYHA